MSGNVGEVRDVLLLWPFEKGARFEGISRAKRGNVLTHRRHPYMFLDNFTFSFYHV